MPKAGTTNKSSRRANSKSNRKDEYMKEDTSKSGNDPAWYAANPEILRDAASYPFSYSTGATELHKKDLYMDAGVYKGPMEQVPGVCSLVVAPSIGTATEPTDPINVASQSVYSFVRHANSGHSNYDAPDLMLYILAMANMYSFLVWCQRLYGYALTYDQRNRYLPSDLIKANCVRPELLIKYLADFRFWMNTLIAKMASFAVPATMSIFSRMTFLFSDYYIEGTSIKDQLYQYVPKGFYWFALDEDSKGMLKFHAFPTLQNVDQVMVYGNDMFNAIWSQEDFGIMSGDILKAYGDNIIKLAPIPEYYNIIPKFDAMVLTQMKNATLVNTEITNIIQNVEDGIIVQTLIPTGFTTTDKYYGTTVAINTDNVAFNWGMNRNLKDYHVVTVDTDNPTPDVVIEATRMKVAYNDYKGWFKSGTEICVGIKLSNVPLEIIDIPAYILISTNQNDSMDASNKLVEIMANFHYLPKIVVLEQFGTAHEVCRVREIFDVDNFTLMDYTDISKLHDAATINMMAVPSVGKVM